MLARRWNVEKYEANEEETVQSIKRRKLLKNKLHQKSHFIRYVYGREKTIKKIVSISILCVMVLRN